MLGIVRDVAGLRARVRDWRQDGAAVGLVPTMGALHEGHLALMRRSLATTERTCVTLFVNPKQFGPHEDFARYPRDEARDLAMIEKAGAHLVFAPDVTEMYPEGHQTQVSVGRIGEILEGKFRPGFFVGVATVVTKLLIQAQPDLAFFGEKDYQQLLVIRRLARDLDIPVEIVGVPTVREKDGLALSSRNAYLSDSERNVAPALHRVIVEAAKNIAAGKEAKSEETRAAHALKAAGFARVDYVAARDAATLEETRNPPGGAGRPKERPGADTAGSVDFSAFAPDARRVLAAAWLGQTRLIDNVAV